MVISYIERFAAASEEHICRTTASQPHAVDASCTRQPPHDQLTSSHNRQGRPYPADAVLQTHLAGLLGVVDTTWRIRWFVVCAVPKFVVVVPKASSFPVRDWGCVACCGAANCQGRSASHTVRRVTWSGHSGPTLPDDLPNAFPSSSPLAPLQPSRCQTAGNQRRQNQATWQTLQITITICIGMEGKSAAFWSHASLRA